MFEDYAARCRRGEVHLGRPYLYRRLLPPCVLNFPTKDHWRSVASLASIVAGLEYLVQNYEAWGISSLAVPPLGCGEGQLEWRIVGPTLYRYLERLAVPVELYAPYGTRHEELEPEFLRGSAELRSTQGPEPQWVKPGWVALVEVLRRIEERPYHWPTGRTLFQKLAYVATAEGLPTGLEYRPGSYGPFSPDLKGVMTRLVNNGLIRERRLGRMLEVEVGPTFADARKAYAEALTGWDALIDRIVDLFVRMDTEEAEVAATVLFVARALQAGREGTTTERDVLEGVMRWKQRRRPPLVEEDVAKTIRNLAALDWIKVKASGDLPLPSDELLYA